MSTFKLTFYGTRGSVPVCDPNFQDFGGNTTCIAFERISNGRVSVLDAGSGLRNFGKDFSTKFPDQKDILMTFTHFHWDHIQGFPFFKPAYDPEMIINIHILGSDQKHTNLKQIFTNQMKEVYFPIPLEQMGCQFNFWSIHNQVRKDQDWILKSIKQNHPGDSYGYRLELEGKVIVVCTDHEHGDSIEERYVEFAKDADVLIHDAQYTTEELDTHKGWGHSSYGQCIELAERANVKHLVMTHHDPDHDDAFLWTVEKQCQERYRDCQLAREGMVVEL